MDAEDFKTCLISVGYNLVKLCALIEHENMRNIQKWTGNRYLILHVLKFRKSYSL